ncbi:MAG TPA: hypothetical protein P5565_08000, partial [Bacteroidia bacterium]|nr:hypothetical protein [Bacteroidia bacterium]
MMKQSRKYLVLFLAAALSGAAGAFVFDRLQDSSQAPSERNALGGIVRPVSLSATPEQGVQDFTKAAESSVHAV